MKTGSEKRDNLDHIETVRTRKSRQGFEMGYEGRCHYARILCGKVLSGVFRRCTELYHAAETVPRYRKP